MLFGKFLLSLFVVAFIGTTQEKCDSLGLNKKQCVQYVKDHAVADYSTLNQ